MENELHLIGVAEIHFWHGFDRLIKGLKEYYAHNPGYKVYFHIVGNLFGERERQEIEDPIQAYNLQIPFMRYFSRGSDTVGIGASMIL